jgi:hypothetical protein
MEPSDDPDQSGEGDDDTTAAIDRLRAVLNRLDGIA